MDNWSSSILKSARNLQRSRVDLFNARLHKKKSSQVTIQVLHLKEKVVIVYDRDPSWMSSYGMVP